MKVLHIETGRHLYGGALQVRYLLEGLAARGVENILVCPEGSEIAAAAGGFAEVQEVSMGGEIDPRLFWHLSRIIRHSRPAILHVHSRRGADIWGPLAARLHHVKALLTRRVDNSEPAWLARMKYLPYQRVVTISEGIRKVLLREGVPADKMTCIPSAVDFREYGRPAEMEWFRSEFGLSPQTRTVGVIAQLIARKGHRYLIEAAPAILEKCPETRFLFFGQGPLEEDLRTLCRARGIEDRVIFAGFRKDLARILPCLDLVVHPATMEGLGVSLLQAAVALLPIVASPAGGIPEIVLDGLTGFLVPPEETGKLASRVVEILIDPVLAARLGSAGRERVERYFSIEAMVYGYLDIYREISGVTAADTRHSTPD